MESGFTIALSVVLGAVFLFTVFNTQKNMNDMVVITTLEQNAKNKLINIREILREDLLSMDEMVDDGNARIIEFEKKDTTILWEWNEGVNNSNSYLKRQTEYSGIVDSTVFREVAHFNIRTVVSHKNSKYYTFEMVVENLESFEYNDEEFFGDFVWKGTITPPNLLTD